MARLLRSPGNLSAQAQQQESLAQSIAPLAGRDTPAGIRQMVETDFDKLHHAFALDRERPHQLDGFQTRLAAKAALHDFCIWLNRQGGRPSLAFIDLLAR